MSMPADYYPELLSLHREFQRALREAPAQPLRAAFLWYQGIQFDRNTQNPSATSRGLDELEYVNGDGVPEQRFPTGQAPKDICGELISKNAADWEGPFQINFRYDRDDNGIWSGAYSIETSAKHRDIVAGRRKYDDAVGDALRANWDANTQARSLATVNRKTEGRRFQELCLIVRRESGSEYSKPDESLQRAWDELVAYLDSQGVRHIFDVTFSLRKQTARLRDGDSAKLFYCV